ncbi:MAG TPA: FecR family protein [Allosphingosinicella sp.]|jgi:hypothetical protein
MTGRSAAPDRGVAEKHMYLVRFLLALLLLSSQPALAQVPAWIVGDVGGAAELRRNGSVQPLRRGLRLQPGDTVETGANGRASLARGREFIVVSPRTRITIPTAAQQQGGMTQIIQHIGRATFNIERRSTPHFGVRTPHLAALVRGTVFTVTVDGQGCRVAVSEGRVEVSTHVGGARELVDPGMRATAPMGAHDRIILDRVEPGDAEAGGAEPS